MEGGSPAKICSPVKKNKRKFYLYFQDEETPKMEISWEQPTLDTSWRISEIMAKIRTYWEIEKTKARIKAKI